MTNRPREPPRRRCLHRPQRLSAQEDMAHKRRNAFPRSLARPAATPLHCVPGLNCPPPVLNSRSTGPNSHSGSFILKVSALLVSGILATSLFAEAVPSASDAIVENYTAATRRQARVMQNATMEVEISGSIPKLKKQGRLHAFRHITALGRITYDALRFQGDDTIKKNVIAKYLQAEEQTQQDPSVAVTPDNYKFKYKGREQLDGR